MFWKIRILEMSNETFANDIQFLDKTLFPINMKKDLISSKKIPEDTIILKEIGFLSYKIWGIFLHTLQMTEQ